MQSILWISLALVAITGLSLAALAYRSRLKKARAEALAAREIIDEMFHDHWTFLAASSRALASSLDYKATLCRVSQMPVPDLADTCTVEVFEEDGSINMATNGDHQTLRPEGAGSERQAEHSDSLMRIPLRSRGVNLGFITFESSRPGFSYTRSHARLAEQLAASAALAIDNARLYARAQAEIKSRERVVALITHDLKNPICAVDVSAQLLQKMSLSPETIDPARMGRSANTIRKSMAQMDALIRDLLDAAKIRNGSFSIQKEPSDLQRLLDEYFEFSQTLAIPKRISVSLNGLQEDRVASIDAPLFFRALSNIVGNAIKFTPDGGSIAIEAGLDGDNAVLSITDSGPGIAPSDLPFVFNDFWQAQDTAKLGTGLGLTIAKGIVEAHGGRI